MQSRYKLRPTRTLGITSISELILFIVRCPKDVITEEINSKDRGTPGISQVFRPEGKVTSLERIHEWYPEQITNGKHEPKSVRDDIYRRQNCGLRGALMCTL
jgi:hypothetical protein